jgi:hypothetical protein
MKKNNAKMPALRARTAGVALAVIFGFVAAGCVSTIAAVEDIPAEELCQLDLSTNYITVTSYDGDSVRWKKGIGGFFTQKLVDLPAGPHTLTGNYDDGTNSANGMSVTFNFEANHVYMLSVQFEGGGFLSSGTASLVIIDNPGRPLTKK